MDGKAPVEIKEPKAVNPPTKKCNRCDIDLPHHAYNIVNISNGKEVCDVCINICIEENKKILEDKNKQIK